MTPGLLFEYCFSVVTGIGAGLLVIGIPLAILGANMQPSSATNERDKP